ncbi:EAL domain-containing protein [Sulfurimonas sp.]|uniref:EAL domain-containing protein n=1 Tax=Sulfurimonas sp. TaxID=2022749 RepID=UPI003D0D9BA5
MKKFLFIFIFIFFTLTNLHSQELSLEEKEWIQQHSTITYSEVNWKPLSIIENGKMDGIMGDYLSLISQRTGLKFQYIPSQSWNDVLEKFNNHKIDLVPGIGSSPQERKLGLISSVYDTYPMLIITDKSYRFVDDLSEFNTKTIAVPKYYTSYNFLVANYPNIKLITTKTIPEALTLVEKGKADAFVGHTATALYYMAQIKAQNLQVSGNAKFDFEHRYLVHKDSPILLSIINKTLNSITEKDKSVIRAKWLQTTMKEEPDYTIFLVVTFVLIAIIILLFHRHYILSKYQKEAIELNERVQLALEGSKSGIWDWDLVTNEVYFSPTWKKILGYRDEEIINSFQEWESRVEPEDLQKAMRTINKAVKGKINNFRILFRMKHKNGQWVWVSSVAKVYFDDSNKPVKISGTHTDVTAQKEAEDELLEQKVKLDHMAHHDSLTGLANRSLFIDRLLEEIKNAKRNRTKLALLFIDLDHFKEINDSLGHAVGDELLKIVTRLLQDTLRNNDSLARLGGDEFTVLMKDLSSITDASVLATKIIDALSQPISLQGNKLYISCSIGISIYPDDGLSTDNLLKYADAAMYKAKNEGRNNFQFYAAEMTELAFERVIMESALREALKKQEFVVYYQPQVDVLTESIIGLEALVRWKHQTMGIIPPSKFIPLAESTGLIIELDQFVMQSAMTQVAQWKKQGYKVGRLSVNVSVKQLQNTNCLEKLQQLIEETGCSYDQIELEVTESQVMTNPENAIEVLQEISDLGIRISIDDFGTGYSSLAYLKRLPINKLKIDRSFVKDLPYNEEDKAITKTIIALAQNLNLDIIAEGIETKEQKDFVFNHGCNKIQGFYYYKPLPAEELEKVLEKA